jgi:rare lipoprotein A
MPKAFLLRIVQSGPRAFFLLIGMLVGLASVSPMHGMGPRRFHAGEIQTGTASWYGAEQGRHTASGERFDPQALTAAHRYLPFNSIIRVTNENNGNTVELRINDRGPFRGGRILDVSEAAADILDMKRAGTVPVLIEVIELGPPTHAHHE